MSRFFDNDELYTEGESRYCYAGSPVLINKLNITDYEELKAAETEFVSARLFELSLKPIAGRFDKRHLYEIHRYVFQDLYEFAGKTRKEDISKGNTKFCVNTYVDEQLDLLFDKVAKSAPGYTASREERIKFFAFIMSELNIIHPFREGNGRAIREFIRQYAVSYGFSVDWSAVKKERLLSAMIASVLNNEELEECLDEILK